MINIKLTAYFFISLLIIVSCSTAPKNPENIEVLRKQAEFLLKNGNKDAEQGKLDNALIQLTDAKKNGILADDLSLIIRSCLSRGNVLYSLGRSDEAFSEWNRAIAEAESYGETELISVSRIYLSRGNLLSGRSQPQTVLSEVTRESEKIKSNRLYIAFSWQVRGLAHRALGSYREAEDAFKRSLEIHEKDKNLENASYDWYTIASIRSLAGNTQDAIDALKASIAIDRRIENSWGIAASYRAMGDVFQKAGRRNDALTSYIRAREIYAAIGNEHEVAQINKRLEN